jgi:hypothetical protein
MKKTVIILISLVLIIGCTKKATIKLPEPESKIVVTCFITPDDSIISAVVRLSTPKFGPVDTSAVFRDDVSDAVVRISDGSNSLVLSFDQDFFFYSAPAKSFPVLPGKTYNLNVTWKNR